VTSASEHALTADEVRWIAHLARLELSAAEVATMTRQLGAILEYVAQLREVDTEGVEPLAHPLPVQNVFRADEPAPSLPVSEALANAPQRREVRGQQFYAVPAVLE
jgi:aspartyl-tRNA(Asn)/glutamyl-tRNA(Gln) amidotransferase subunit C